MSGSLSCGGDVTVANELKCSGSVKCDGSIKCSTLTVSGGLSASGDVEAENVKVSGKLSCDGLLNAEKIDIEIDGRSCKIGSIGGSDIKIYNGSRAKAKPRLPLFAKLVGSFGGVEVKESIEGDVIAIENVRTPLVVGRIVAIGAGCKIDLVQYSEALEIDPDAEVLKKEKI